MKNKVIIVIIMVVVALCLIIGGIVLTNNKSTKPQKEKKPTSDVREVEGYRESESKSLKEDQTFNGIKYTQNHLSTANWGQSSSFTSVVFNETGIATTNKHIEIDFYDANENLIGTIESEIEPLKPSESTIIFGVVMQDLSAANSFKVRDVTK